MLLELPARTAARWVALSHLRAAAGAAERRDLSALRSALLRLDAALRAFRPALRDTVRGRHRRRVRDLLARTGPAHDAGALIARAEALLAADPAAAADCEPLLADLAARRAAAERKLTRRLDRRFERVARPLRKRLSRHEVRIGSDVPEPPPTMARALAGALAERAGEARARLAAIAMEGEEDAVRRAAVAVARLLHLLEPFAAELPDGGTLAEELRELHSLVEERDGMEELAGEVDARAPAGETLQGMLLLARRARADEAAAELETRRREGALEGLLGRIEEIAAGLGGAGDGVEIERKYLLSGLPELPDTAETLEVEQGWFGERIPERVRRVRSGAGLTAFRAIKHGRGVRRLELEEPISTALFEVLWPLTEGRRVRKRRHRATEGELCWEIDEFTDRDLVLAEVELPAAGHPIEFPAWLAPLVVREVTDEGAYVNLNLAR